MLSLLDDEPGDHPGWTYTESHSEGNCTGSFAIRKGDWKYIHFQWYHGLLYNLKEDPGEFVNRIDDPTCAEVLTDLKAILDSQVDTEQVTRDVFEKQDGVVRGLAEGKTEEEFATLLQGRLGEGQARALASKYVGGIG